ncbi:hypothetical protein A0H81_01728 [Grifola frondosa]|uniref:Uncharacterized protein n=1 Tax=Grifola frondosa TaxID=5627 RepID=A0A1C7MKU0_GRIFR|nr:hypothetical protein A0H81_01728 [Grifola frondosa]
MRQYRSLLLPDDTLRNPFLAIHTISRNTLALTAFSSRIRIATFRIPTTLSSPFVSKRNVAATPKTPRTRLRPSGITVQWTPHHSMSTPHHPMTGPPRSPPITPATPGFSHPFSPLYSCCSPLEYPSLDTPFYPTEVNDARSDAAEALTSHPAVIAASNRIVAACGQISAMVQRPFLTLCDAGMGYHLPSCLRFLEASHTVEILRAAGPRGMHVDDLAQRISEIRRGPPLDALNQGSSDSELNVDPGKLSHVLRLLATHHIIREVRPALRVAPAGKYESTNGIAAFVGLCTDELFKASAYLTDCYLLPLAEPTLPPLTPAISHPPTPTKIPNATGSKTSPACAI